MELGYKKYAITNTLKLSICFLVLAISKSQTGDSFPGQFHRVDWKRL